MAEALAELVEALSTAGGPEPEPSRMRQLKRLCRASPEEVPGRALGLLMAQLSAAHGEVRLGAFRVVEQLFCRSLTFRAAAVRHLPELLALAAGTDLARPLPPPAAAARQLRAAAVAALRLWHHRYGHAHPQLGLACRFLQDNKKVDFQDADARTPVERRREEERQKRLERLHRDQAQRAEKDMEDMSPEIETVLTEMENCFRLLMPDPFDFTVEDEQPCCSKDLPSIARLPEVDDRCPDSETGKGAGREDTFEHELTSGCLGGGDDGADEAAFVRSHGLGSHKYALSLEISTDVKLEENEDNTAIINSVTDAHKLIRNKFLPSVQSWIQLFTRAAISDDRLRKAIDLKNKLEKALEKHKDMNIDYKKKRKNIVS
uniref:Uncharacterized protein n=1 Tax=Sphaerodactylus townsendi TaxID=933632 RepID=A0ACB8FJ42_9SAUR